MHLDPDSAYTSKNPRELQRTNEVRLAALSCSCVSVVASTIALYWFCRMSKRFRHRLIMILIYGDLMRGTWYFIFAAVSLTRGMVQTHTIFCQASGFFMQYGTETSDYGVLVIAIHSALQVFRPANQGKSDVLHHYRHFVFAGALLLPVLMAGLAFVNSGSGYLSQGAYCMLPIRPFWYLLALAWIPRYLIVLIIFGLAIAIYAHVGFEFRSYAKSGQNFKTPLSTTTSIFPQSQRDIGTSTTNRQSFGRGANADRWAPSPIHNSLSSQGAGSAVASNDRTVLNRTTAGELVNIQPLPELSLGNQGILSPASPKPLFAIPSGHTITHSASTPNLASPLSLGGHTVDEGTAVAEEKSSPLEREETSSREPSPMTPAQRRMARQRQHIHRQLRLMFIYPMAYTLMWVIPFVNHCMQYNDYFAAHPVPAVRLGSTVCISLMGVVDCLIFSVREKPWRSVQTSDGTIWGSFTMWRKSESRKRNLTSLAQEYRGGMPVTSSTMESSGPTRIARIRSSVRTSGSNDYTRNAAEQARVRLDMEREERLAAFQAKMGERRGSELSNDDDVSPNGPEATNKSRKGSKARSSRSTQAKGKEKAVGAEPGYFNF